MPIGSKKCLGCGKEIELKIKRDIERKKFCSRSCMARYYYPSRGLVLVETPEEKIKRIEKIRATLAIRHPMSGKKHSPETIAKIRATKLAQWKPRKSSGGYVYITVINESYGRRGRVLEHIVVAEKKINRHLSVGEVVHHLNGIKDDNRPENLEVMQRLHHNRLHAKEAWNVSN